MANPFKAVEIAPNIFWVGAIDWNIDDFHGYRVSRGTTYNAYLIKGEKNILIDTVKQPFFQEMLLRISSVIAPTDIDYIISNHSEMDHSGCLPQAIDTLQPDSIFASAKGVETLEQHFGLKNITAVKDNKTMVFGDTELLFLETRMLHWPDSMFTYLPRKNILFSQDAFGMHLASTKRFADQLPAGIIDQEASKYYANILMPYSTQVIKLLDKIKSLELPIDMIAPDHGPLWRQDLDKILNQYYRWATPKRTNKALVVYDSMWNSTDTMAKAISEGLSARGIDARIMSLKHCHRSDVAKEILGAGALILGSPTLNNNIYPSVADLLCYLKGLRPKNLIGAVFGSYGWSGESIKICSQALVDMKIDIVGEVKTKYVPDEETLSQCDLLAEKICTQLKLHNCYGG